VILQRLSPSTLDDEDFIYEMMKRAILLSGINAPKYRSPRDAA
jgi:hypothetical protein